METKKEHNLKVIADKLALFKHTISMRDSSSLYDINICAEDVICELLNIVYGFQLKNLNCERKNYPGIDLGDTDNGIAVQITSDNSREKVKKTLNKFAEYGYMDKYSRLILFILGDKKRFSSPFESGQLQFSAKKDILDFNDLIRAISLLNSERIEMVCSYLDQELTCEVLETHHTQTKSAQMYDEFPEDNSAKKLDNAMSQEAERIYTKIQKLKRRFGLGQQEINRIDKALNDIRTSGQKLCLGQGIIAEYSEELRLFEKVLSFIQSLDRCELEFLNEIGIRIRIQVVTGSAQGEANLFFTLCNEYREDEDPMESMREYGLYIFDRYTFEQFSRMLSAYESILQFDPNMLDFSTGYACGKGNIGNVLAVSVTGKSKKIYIWDISARNSHPVAVLAGLFEAVGDVKIFRVDGHIYVTACGTKRLYLWDLNTDSFLPTSIFSANGRIAGYSLYRSRNERLYLVATVNRKLYFWGLGSKEEYCFSVDVDVKDEDAYIINTQIVPGHPIYCVLGNSACSSNVNNSVYLLKEVAPLEFEIECLCDGKQLCDNQQNWFGPDYGISSYQMAADRPVLGALTRQSLFLYDILKKEKFFSMAQKGQQMCNFRMMSGENGDLYLLVYYLFISGKDDGRGLVRCFCVRNGRVIDERECFHADVDIRRAVMSKERDDIYVFFNKYDDNVLLTASYDKMDDYREFYTLPDSLGIVDMACE